MLKTGKLVCRVRNGFTVTLLLQSKSHRIHLCRIFLAYFGNCGHSRVAAELFKQPPWSSHSEVAGVKGDSFTEPGK